MLQREKEEAQRQKQEKIDAEIKKRIDERYKQAEKFLENNFKEVNFSDDEQRIKRNLLIVASIVLFYKLSGAEIEMFNLFGVEIIPTKQNFIDYFLLAVILYHWITFLPRCREIFLKYNYKINGRKTLGWFSEWNIPSEKQLAEMEPNYHNAEDATSAQNGDYIEKRYHYINNRIFLRWLIIDTGLPLALSLLALFLLLLSLWNS